MTTLNWEFSAADLRDASDAWPAGPAVADCPHQPYSEEAFRYFLGLERKRAERSRRSLLLLLVNVTADDDGGQTIPPGIASKLFSGLSLCVRDVDFIGWYRHGRVAGAVLTQGADSPALESSEQIVERVTALLGKRLPAAMAARLQHSDDEFTEAARRIYFVEQNVEASLRLAHRAYILEGGRIVREGAAAALLDDPGVRRAYLGPLAVRG